MSTQTTITQQDISEAWSAWKKSRLHPLIGQPIALSDGEHTWHIGTVPTDRIRVTVKGGRLESTDFVSGLSWNARTGYGGRVHRYDRQGYWCAGELIKPA